MTQKTVGYVELEWTCKRCGTRNPGTQKTCQSCGAAMTHDDKFELPAEGKLITEKEKLEKATLGPDIHCPYCGARNVATATKCSQCGGPLGEGLARASGQVLGAHIDAPAADVNCPFCGTPNPASAVKCQKCGGALGKAAPPAAPTQPVAGPSRLWIIVAVIAAIACIGGIILFSSMGGRTAETRAVVQDVTWERIIPVLGQMPVQYARWADELPSGVQGESCTRRLRRTQDEPAPGAEEVCGTPYVQDQGSGVGKVVQDCQYNIYDDWCTYSVLEWTIVDRIVAQGNDLNPTWPQRSLQAGQREGDERTETYSIVFRLEDQGRTVRYTPRDAQEFAQFVPGSAWELEVNGFGSVTGIRPAQ